MAIRRGLGEYGHKKSIIVWVKGLGKYGQNKAWAEDSMTIVRAQLMAFHVATR